MVIRIFRDAICRSSKFRRAKLNVLQILQRSTSSEQRPDEVASSKKNQRTHDRTLGYQQFDDPNSQRPTLYIAHTSVFNPSQDDDKKTETLLKSLKKKLETQPIFTQKLPPDEAQQKEASSDEEAPDKQAHHDHLQTDTEYRFQSVNDGDASKDDQLLQRPEPINDSNESKAIINNDNPDIKPPHVRYRFDVHKEAQMLDDLAAKYMSVEQNEIDKRLGKDMEREGLPVNTSEALDHASDSSEDNTVNKVDEAKPEEPQPSEVAAGNPQYYEQVNWCNVYFKSKDNESTSDLEERAKEMHEIYGPNAFSDEMLPLHCCLDFDTFGNNETDVPVKKLGFEKHDDIIPFHQLQCADFIKLDLRETKDTDSPIENMNEEEILPIHLFLQRNLIDDVASAPNAIEATEYEFITPLEEFQCYTYMSAADIFHSLTIDDANITKFDYTFPRDSNKTINQIKNERILKTVPEPILDSERASNDKLTDDVTNTDYKPKTEAEIKVLVNAKIMEQIRANTAPLQPHGGLDRLVQNNPPLQQIPMTPNEDMTTVVHTKILEQLGARPDIKRTTHSAKGIDALVQMQPPNMPVIDSNQKLNEPLTKVVKNDASCQKIPTNVQIYDEAKSPKTAKVLTEAETSEKNLLKAVNDANLINTARLEETKPTRETEAMVQSCVQTVPGDAQKTYHPNTLSQKTPEEIANQLSLDLNLSLSELLRRVRARNRLQYLTSITGELKNMTAVNEEKRCPPSDRPQCPPPPDCITPCPPPWKPKCPPEPPECPPEPPKCPPEPPKCPPEPPKCPPEPPKCPPKEEPKCPPDPPECPPEPPKCPCPCPLPPKCPPGPPKCPCQATDPNDLITLLHSTIWDYKTTFNVMKCFLGSGIVFFPNTSDDHLETSLNLNRIRDFEPWTPIPSWPFPVEVKNRKLQCPYHGCPFPKPGPVRPNCPELPCAGFPKRLRCSEKSDN